MLKYLIVQLCDSASSFCYYDCKKESVNLITLDDLKAGLLWAMKENLIVQFVYPSYVLPKEYQALIDTVDHIDIKSNDPEADIPVYTGINDIPTAIDNQQSPNVIRLSKTEFLANIKSLIKYPVLNIVITDIYTLNESEHKEYEDALRTLSISIQKRIEQKSPVHINLLTNRMQLSAMNNCNAGVESITLAPNGKFYICPAFYFDNDCPVGSPKEGLLIPNKNLYALDFAPICKKCDAFQCKRCVWLNKKTTCEVNTPSHEQCVASHIERNVSRELLETLKKNSTINCDITISPIDYLDPFDNF